jgi:prolyl-tRNA editing enzyme YbaK/EbsC (Cys-tRNA(Pro) deacylase)
VTDLSHPAIQRVVEVASRKGVTLDITVFGDSTHTAEDAAATVGAELGQIVKSLVFVAPRFDGRLLPIVALASGRNRVDIHLLAAVVGETSIRRATASEVRELTGFSIGGVPPFGHGRNIRTVMDQDLCVYEWVWAAAGTDSAVFRVSPGTLRMLANATVAPIAETSWAQPARVASIEPRLQFEAGSGA